ncbi:histidine kinase [Dysgonomonas sp. OttesenSCG-928-M03]|nr:histidine kinase [Dysgonomonas sp. OttesenSCG-928-M03]
MHPKYLLIILSLFLSVGIRSQSIVSRQNKASYELSKSLEEGNSDEKLAQSYEAAAKEQAALDEYAKAEGYLNKAKQLYQKLKKKEKIAYIERELAKIQESQNKFDEAISNYNSASRLSTDKVQQAINSNDMQRVMNNSNPQAQKELINQNIKLLENTTNQQEKATAYQQMADVNLQLENKNEAIGNLNKALKDTKNPLDEVKINRQIANIYVENKDYDKAIDINEKLVEKAKNTKDSRLEAEQLRNLSSVYFEGHETQKGLTSLQEAYDLALEEGHTIEAKKSLELLTAQYMKENNTRKTIDLYSGFMDKLETLIKSDSSLIDSKLYLINEEKISQLEKEKVLKDELIERTNNLNYVLIISFIVALIFVLLIAKSLYSNKKKSKKIALQSLRREMNPHFIFNSLNSVNQFIAQNNELEANKYLSSYSKLMRNIMENSNKDFIPLSTEIEQMKEYLDLEYMRFKDKFSYRIDIDENLDTDTTLVPNMLIQPQLENAIWHGLRYKEEKGILELNIKKDINNNLIIIIEDNGIGLKKSRELKTQHQKVHQSRGLTNTKERIQLLNTLYNSKIDIDIADKPGNETGVKVMIKLPIINKKHG